MDLPPDEMRRRVAGARVGRLGTIDERGRPHLVPFVYVLDGDTLYSPVDDKPKTTRRLKRLANLERNPNATVLVDHYEEEWPRIWWVRLRGNGRVLRTGDEYVRAGDLLAGKYPQYGGQPPEDNAIIAIDVTDWLGWAYASGADSG